MIITKIKMPSFKRLPKKFVVLVITLNLVFPGNMIKNFTSHISYK